MAAGRRSLLLEEETDRKIRVRERRTGEKVFLTIAPAQQEARYNSIRRKFLFKLFLCYSRRESTGRFLLVLFVLLAAAPASKKSTEEENNVVDIDFV